MSAKCEPVVLDKFFNSSVTDIFNNKYLSPRSPYTTLQIPVQGIGEWCHPLTTAEIDDSGLRAAVHNGKIDTKLGIPFRTPATGRNIAFTSLWDNYPDSISFPLKGKASRAYLLMAGSTNHMSVYKALERMKDKRIGQALICDEFGGFQGIITLKDILEGLVGNIEDAHTEPDIIKRKEGEGWFVDGQCPVYDFFIYFEKENLYSNQSDYTTVGGLVLELLQHIPQSGEAVSWKDFTFEIVDMDGARIDKILVKVTE